MASVLTIDISATRAITATGRLVAGETASISIVGATPAKLYLINAQRDVIAYCDSFGADGSGAINLATTQIASIVANIPAGRAFSVSCLIEDDGGDVVGFGYVPLVSAPMPDDLESIDVDLYLRASTIRQLFADIPESYSNQRNLSAALSQVVNILKTIGLAACIAFTALATEWQDVPADTIIGAGLTLTNGTISAAGGGGITTNDVRNIVEAGGMVVTGRVTIGDANWPQGQAMSIEGTHIRLLDSSMDIQSDANSLSIIDTDVWLDSFEYLYGNLESLPDYITGRFAARGITNDVGTAAFRDADEFATATDEAILSQLIMGSNVVAEVTNYNSRVHSPTLRLLQLDNDTREYFPVWTETNGLSRATRAAAQYTDAVSNALDAAKADRAWSKYTSGMGVDAPAGVTWISTPETVIAGGYEYAKMVTSHGEVWVLSSNGLGLGADSNSYFRVTDGAGETLFSIEKTDSVLVGVDASSISVSGGVVTIPLGVVSQEAPVCYATTSLVNPTWADLSEATPSWITAASCAGSAGAWVWTIETTAPSAFFQFRVMQEGSTIIRNNAQTDLSQGIVVNGVRFYPHINNGQLTWTTTP